MCTTCIYRNVQYILYRQTFMNIHDWIPFICKTSPWESFCISLHPFTPYLIADICFFFSYNIAIVVLVAYKKGELKKYVQRTPITYNVHTRSSYGVFVYLLTLCLADYTRHILSKIYTTLHFGLEEHFTICTVDTHKH